MGACALGRQPRPRQLRALGGRPGGAPQSWDQSQSEGQEVAAAPVAQGSRRPEVPRTLPSSDPAPAGRRAGGCGPWPGRVRPAPPGSPPKPLRQKTSLLGPAGPAPFFRHPHPREAASPPTPVQGPGAPSQPGTAVNLRHARPGPEAHSGRSSGGQSIFSLLFFSSIKRVKNPRSLCVTFPGTARGPGLTGLGPSAASETAGEASAPPCLRPAWVSGPAGSCHVAPRQRPVSRGAL